MGNTIMRKAVYSITIWSVALFLALLTYLQPGTHLEPGLDQSWAYGINYAFYKGLVLGGDVFFTFGPLGFLEHTRVLSDGMLYASVIFSLLVSLGMGASLLHLSCRLTQDKTLRYANLLLSACVILLVFPAMQRLLILGYVCLALHLISGRRLYLVLLSTSAVLCLLVKFSYGLAAISMVASYGIYLGYQQRRIAEAFLAALALIGTYGILWLLIYGSLTGAMGYIQGGLAFSSGNSSAMVLSPENNWWAIAGFYLCCILSGVVLHKHPSRKYAALPLVFIFPLFVWTKYAFTQEGSHHLYPLLDFAIFVMAIFFILSENVRYKIKIFFLLVGICFTWNRMHTPEIGPPDYVNLPKLRLAIPEIVHYDFDFAKLFSVWRAAEKERLKDLHLPETMREKIGNASVDIYPWELTIAEANHLNWHPRPVFQNYITYTHFLDEKNREFYSSSSAPEYIVWHYHSFQDVMQRFPLSTDPLTLEALFRHYRLEGCEDDFCLWKHMPIEQLLPTIESKNAKEVTWGQWVPVPETRADIVRAKIFATRTLLGRVNLLLWKEGGIEIDYKLMDGTIRTHDLLIDNAVSGAWISPYSARPPKPVVKNPENISKQELRTILSRTTEGYIEKVDPTLTGNNIIGWAAVASHEPESARFYVLLFNQERAILIPVKKVSRSDVTNHFSSLGRADLINSGFYEELTPRNITVGDYQIRLVAKVDGQWAAIADQGFSVSVKPREPGSDVIEIRFRTHKPWAFSDKLSILWQQLNFTGDNPWK